MKKATKRPLVSIVVPVFNAEKYLDECISSIVRQSYDNIEVILIDDGSSDNSPIICDTWKKKDKRIVVIHRKNSGVSATRNLGLSISNGDYIAFIDADDWVDKNYIETLVNNIEENKSDICICGINRVAANGVTKLAEDKGLIDGNDFLLGVLKVRNGFGVCYAKIYKSNIARSSSFSEALTVGEDALYNLGVSNHVKCVSILDAALYNYRVHSESVVRRYNERYVDSYYRSMESARSSLAHALRDKSISEAFYDYIAFHVMLVAVNYCCNPKNSHKRKSLKSLYKLNLFRTGIEKSHLGTFPKSKQIVLFSLKHRLYGLCIFLCSLRQRQNRTRSSNRAS